MTPEELTGYNQKDLRMLNRMSVFRMIFENRTISRAEIARQTGLNPATVTNIAKELMRQGWVEETGPERVEVSLGRPRSGLRIKADAGYIVSISVERYRVEIAITDLCFHRMVYREFRAGAGGAHSSYSEYLTVQQALDVLDETIAGSGVPVEQILGIGVAAPGPVDVTAGALLNVPNFPGWSGLPLRQLLSRRLPVPVHITRDANACALAEKWFGVARDLDQYLCVVAATGIGGSLVLNGDIFGGANFLAGEFGHVTINPDGERCDCGNVGCLELYASPQAMARRATEAIEAGEASLLSRLVDGNHSLITFEDVVQAGLEGDALCRRIIHESIEYILTALVTSINVIDPEAVVFGGKFALLEPFLDESVQTELRGRIFANPIRCVPFLFGTLADETPLLGAYALVLSDLFQSPSSRSRF